MKVNDRGTMKWTSIMLPEHIEALNKMWEEQDHKEMPEIDEQQIAENNLLLQDALENDLQIRIKYFADHDHKIIVGYLLHIDILNKRLFLNDIEINLEHIIEVTLL
ncbi:YolD-like family protein [Pseudogracilibacillus auburnensis]|uniref:YolD-like protein n=1 Tax=Pseudogracilibacillus auburnensis TaxID=1494959 RepID=A0A2V3W3G7_9BACI|nr:YolD-like family protein [Pseudogracilibacillus auburnensis]PXW88837.1 YolD-like protein [Pseudogracilibacillus auburnensis]